MSILFHAHFLSDSEVEELLNQDDTYFFDDDRRFIKEITGEHPYLLQVAASALSAIPALIIEF